MRQCRSCSGPHQQAASLAAWWNDLPGRQPTQRPDAFGATRSSMHPPPAVPARVSLARPASLRGPRSTSRRRTDRRRDCHPAMRGDCDVAGRLVRERHRPSRCRGRARAGQACACPSILPSIAEQRRRERAVLGALRGKVAGADGDRIAIPQIVELVDRARGEHVELSVAAGIERVERVSAVHLH